ncbi:2Fe-2S iron-sulfur cluster-binding protein [Rhizorhabdus histidinilytica]
MTEIRFIDADGTVTIARGDNGFSLMEVARRHGVAGIVAECGGSCACATCHVHIDPAWLEAVGEPSPGRPTCSTSRAAAGPTPGCPARSGSPPRSTV